MKKKFISIDKDDKPVYKWITYQDQDKIVSELGSERFPVGERKLKRETITACEYRFWKSDDSHRYRAEVSVSG